MPKISFICILNSLSLCLEIFSFGSATKVFVDGAWVGIHTEPEDLVNQLRR